LSGCVSFSNDGGFSEVSTIVAERTGYQAEWARTEFDIVRNQKIVASMLDETLTADTAVRIALFNNPGLQASLTELGIQEADLVQAGRLKNPLVSYGKVPQDGILEIERRVMFDVMHLLTMPVRTKIEQRKFQQAKLQAAMTILKYAFDTKKAYFEAIAATESLHYMRQVKEATQASSLLGRQMMQVGNWSHLQLAHEQSLNADMKVQVAKSKLICQQTKEQLTQLMGLQNPSLITLPERLPALPNSISHIEHLRHQAAAHRLDVQIQRLELDALCKNIGLKQGMRFTSILDISYLRNSTEGDSPKNGYEIDLQIPIFDWGDASLAKAKAQYMQSIWRLRQTVLNAQSQVRSAYLAYQTKFEIAKMYRDEIVPNRKLISKENILRYNGMLISPFELLADARDQITSVNAYIEAQKDFWVAKTEIESALMMNWPGHDSEVNNGV
jgi:outer membrane protein TolC